jgi:hypothetical protein
MKNFSKALVLSVAMLLAANANAKNVEVNKAMEIIGVSSEEFNPKAYFFGKNKKAADKAILAHYNAKSILAALMTIQKTKQAELDATGSVEAKNALQKVNNLIARIVSENRFKKAYSTLVYKGEPCILEKREFRKIAAKAIVNSKVQAAA